MAVDPLVKELETLRKKHGISRSLCSSLLKISETTFYRWSAGLHQPSVYYRREVQKLLDAIKEIKKKDNKHEKHTSLGTSRNFKRARNF